ncbi:bifunctional demethylmenaquinone methyltransferase/2-methoxy-6-polyprenyl-1,4-benzoquinol methylase UbiE [Roseiconus nitratireducens]|uniref:Demethylmenaquinone methyltransferase n=1 Tax=Roseiconus nitratireducens TaxID=2605748 RepID=A0A5M6CZW6_9BACT|nr:bifunctional demethylmenaquinone methyltransferase/2-methoxy-6-polyprenyl-1,4-benzoquinol methylase UbiE [Roseiconus nitratireducens]KAA5540633.1 bifunctional demethylmenaquinone methyltransferase/2-methoxy-6-polyprenyl-1,4-benzoquinol methylase UbiE [Roseiconus nitratireducens]
MLPESTDHARPDADASPGGTASSDDPSNPFAASRPTTTAAAPPALDKSNDRVREMFRQIAPRYDLMNHLLSLNIDKHWRRQAVRRMRLEPGLPVLDVCTGTGDLAIAMAHHSPSNVDVVGSDFCHAMLEIARDKRVPGTPSEPIQFLEADSQQLPFEDDVFQCVTVAFGLRNVADTDRGLREMTRVCRGGGQVMVLEFSRPTLFGLRHGYNFYFTQVLPRLGQWFARNNKAAYEYLPESVGQFPDGQALADRMVQAGLTDVRFTPLTFGVCTIYEGTKPGYEGIRPGYEGTKPDAGSAR